MTMWLSFDVETTGPVPGLHSMISVGVVALLDSGDSELGEVSSFYRKLRMLDDTADARFQGELLEVLLKRQARLVDGP